MAWAERSIEIDAGLERVWQVITDFEAYPEFLADMQEARIDSREGETGVRASFELQILKRIRYTLDFSLAPPERMDWTLVKGDFMKRNEGGWRLQALGEGRTRATYRIALALGAIVPESITNRLAAEQLPSTLEAFKRRIERAAT
ncbi:MAG: SRPBCC family protein [Deltaproteobacteria bacterium]|nr:SRPBCC family protein [Deltaproteobacteria bacterium]